MLVTDRVFPDDPAYGLYELNYPAQGTGSWHRYQIIQVMRGDRVVEHRTDLGPAKKYSAIPQIRIPGGVVLDSGRFEVVHTVGELREIADQMRGLEPPHHEVPDLIGGYHKELDKRKDRRRGRVRFAVTQKW